MAENLLLNKNHLLTIYISQHNWQRNYYCTVDLLLIMVYQFSWIIVSKHEIKNIYITNICPHERIHNVTYPRKYKFSSIYKNWCQIMKIKIQRIFVPIYINGSANLYINESTIFPQYTKIDIHEIKKSSQYTKSTFTNNS